MCGHKNVCVSSGQQHSIFSRQGVWHLDHVSTGLKGKYFLASLHQVSNKKCAEPHLVFCLHPQTFCQWAHNLGASGFAICKTVSVAGCKIATLSVSSAPVLHKV